MSSVVALLIVLKIFPSRKLILMELYRVARSQPRHTLLLTIFFTFGIIHVHSPVLNLASQWGREEYMPIRPVAEQIGERFGRFDSAVRISFPLPSYPIFTLTPAPADPNRLLLLPWALQSHPRVTLRSSDHLQARTAP